MPLRPALITGTSFERLFLPQRSMRAATPYGPVLVFETRVAGHRILNLPRHGPSHRIPPHAINYRANIYALKKLGAQMIIATGLVGSLNRRMKPSDFVVADQFLDFTKSRPFSFSRRGRVIHVDMTKPFDEEIRQALLEACRHVKTPVHSSGTYVCTEGPRFETASEIKMFNRLGGHIVGMTAVPEAVLAKELKLPYAILCLVVNWAASLQPAVSHHEGLKVAEASAPVVKRVLEEAVMWLTKRT